MKAIVYEKYGSPDVLSLQEVNKPVPKDNEVLVKVYAASINSWDWDMVRGKPFIVRLWGLLTPKYKIPGADISGRVEVVGKNVTLFKPGDEVFGDLCESGWGAFAEYTCALENSLTLKPEGMTFEEAASLPQAGVMALQSLRDKGQVKSGQKVLINGAGGGVGTIAIQIAKSLGAEVTGVDTTLKLDLLRSVGADYVIDYTREDFTKNGLRYDLIIDVISNRSIFAYKRSLNSEGSFIMIGGTMGSLFQAMLLGSWIASTGNKKLGMLAYRQNRGLDFLGSLFTTGKVLPVIDRVYPLHDTPEAFRYYTSGQVKGKVVIRMS
jgi:NADPH:quinone reductase-like Zn-dependent oxidoreductase